MTDLLLDALGLLSDKELASIAQSAESHGKAMKAEGDPFGLVLEIVGNAAQYAMVQRGLEISNF